MKLNSKLGMHLIIAVIMFSLILFSSFLLIERKSLYDDLKEAAYHSESFLPRNYHSLFHSEKGISKIEYRSFLQEIKKFALIGGIDELYILEYVDGTPVISMRLPKTDYEKQNPYETTYNQRVKNPKYLAKALKLGMLDDSTARRSGILSDGTQRYIGVVISNKDFAGNKYVIITGYSLKKVVANFFKKYSIIIGNVFLALSFTIAFLIYIFNKSKKSEIISASDELTGFYTRKYISVVNRRVRGSGVKYWGIIYVDLDRLKQVNDTYGHKAGDAYISSFSKVMREVFRQDDIVIRMGGDEFLIVTPLEDLKNIELIIRRLEDKKSKELSYSIGWEAASKKELLDRGLDEVIKKADEKMYEEKRKRSNSI